MRAVYSAPGRVNLIGEHTDYNAGLALPMALGLECTVEAAPGGSGALTAHSAELGESRSWACGAIERAEPARDWGDYVAGVARELALLGYAIPALDLRIRSTVPIGAGLSSSAALEVAAAKAILGGREIDPAELARLCRRAENRFVGVPCGGMDQTVAVFGRPGSALLIDFRDQSMTEAPLPAGGRFLVVDSMVKHELAASAYRERVAECKAAVEAVRRARPEVETLRDVAGEDLVLIDGTPRKRAAHVGSENLRVLGFVKEAAAGDLAAMGRRMVGSHISLQRDYQVSCAELDFLVSTAISVQGVFGARMTGGGFGGCTVNLMRPEAADVFRERITLAYEKEYGVTPRIYECGQARAAETQ